MKFRNIHINDILMSSILLFCVSFHCHAEVEYENGDLKYLITQLEESPMWLEISQSDSYRKLNSVSIPDEVMISGFSMRADERPAVVEKIGSSAFESVPLTYIKIPSSVKRIGKRAFADSQLERIDMEEGLLSIDEKAFSDLYYLTSVKIPESVRFMGFSCFSGCSSLKEVDLPSTLNSLGGFTFRYCGNLIDIYCRALTPPLAYDSDFGVIHFDDYFKVDLPDGPQLDECVLHVPAGTENLYREAPGWKLFKNIIAIEDHTSETVKNFEDTTSVEYSTFNGLLSLTCKAGDTLTIYDAGGICQVRKVFTTEEEFKYRGSGIIIIKVNEKSVKVNL